MTFRKDLARLCKTVGGNATFQVAGSVADGARIWVGRSKQPLTFDQAFFERLLSGLGEKGEIRIGSKFDDPGPDSLGEWIQQDQGIAMNPAVYIGGLLIDEGYAESPRRGRITIFRERRTHVSLTDAARGDDAIPEVSPRRAELQRLVEQLGEEQMPRAVAAIQEILQEEPDASPFESLRGDPDFILPSAPRTSVRRFKPVKLEGRPLSRDVIENRR